MVKQGLVMVNGSSHDNVFMGCSKSYDIWINDDLT